MSAFNALGTYEIRNVNEVIYQLSKTAPGLINFYGRLSNELTSVTLTAENIAAIIKGVLADYQCTRYARHMIEAIVDSDDPDDTTQITQLRNEVAKLAPTI